MVDKLNGMSANTDFVRTKTINREVDGVKQEVTIKFGKDGSKSYFVDGKQVYVASDGPFRKKSFTTEKPPVSLTSLNVGDSGTFNVEGHGNIKGKVCEDANGNKYIESSYSTDNGVSTVTRYAQNSDGSIGVSYRKNTMPDGHAVELIYKDGERVAVNRIVPDTVAEQGTQESNVGEEANLLPEVEVAANKPSPKGLPEELLTQNFQPEISPEPVIYNGGVLPEVEVAANKSSSTSFTGTESLAQNSQENPINGGVLPEVVITANRSSSTGFTSAESLAQNSQENPINGGVLPEVVITANRPSSTSFTGTESLAQNSQESPINGGVLPEVEVAASKPSPKGLPEELLAQNQPSINQDKNIFNA